MIVCVIVAVLFIVLAEVKTLGNEKIKTDNFNINQVEIKEVDFSKWRWLCQREKVELKAWARTNSVASLFSFLSDRLCGLGA